MEQQAKRAYKRALERGYILAPKESSLEKRNLKQWWEAHKTLGFEHLKTLDNKSFKEAVLRKEESSNARVEGT